MDIMNHVIFESIALCVDSLVLGFCVRQLLKYNNVIFSLEKAPTLDINKDLKVELDKYSNNTIPYAIMRGIVKPLGNSINSTTNKDISGVIQKIHVQEHVIARNTGGFWSHQSRTLQELYNYVPFVLSGKAIEIEIVDALEAKILEMEITSDRFEPISPTVMDYIWGFFAGLHQRGVQTTEEMLRNGTYVTAVGELNGYEGGLLKLQPPRNGLPLYLTTSSKSNLLKKIGESRNFLRVLVLMFGSIGILLSGRILMRYMSRKKRYQQEKKIKERLAISRRERRAKVRESTLLHEDQLCVVCVDNPKEIILLPCGHVALCEDCSQNINDVCPVCRTTIVSKEVAFIT